MQIECDIQIEDSLVNRSCVRIVTPCCSVFSSFDHANVSVKIVPVQQGDGGECFGRVRCGLQLEQTVGIGNNLVDLFRVELLPDFFEPLFFFLFVDPCGFSIGSQGDGRLVLVIDKVTAEHFFKKSGFSGFLFNGLQRFFKGDQGERIGAVIPGIQRFEHKGETARESAAVVFAQIKFEGV